MWGNKFLNDRARLDFYLAAVYAFFLCISLAGTNVILGIALIWGMVSWKRLRDYSISLDGNFVKAIMLFLGSMLLSTVVATDTHMALQQIWSQTCRFLPLILAITYVRTKKQLSIILLLLGISIMIADLYSVKQSIEGIRRATAFTSNAMLYAGQLILLLPIFSAALLAGKNVESKKRLFFVIVILLSIIGLLLNGTRGAWLAVFLALCIPMMIIAKKNPRMWIGVLLGVIVCSMFVLNNPYIEGRLRSMTDLSQRSPAERLLVWSSAWQMFKDNPIIGVGTNNFEKVYMEKYISPKATLKLTHAHNNFLQMLAENGIIGFCTFAFLFGYIFFSKFKEYLKAPDTNYWALGIALATLSLLLHGLTEYNFDDPQVMRLYWFLLGLSYVSRQINEGSCIESK